MKKKRLVNVIIIAVLVAFLAVCIGFIFGSNTYSARAEELTSEAPQDSTDSTTSDEMSEDEETPDEDIGFDLDAFLEWVQKYADEAGIGDEYAAAVEAIKTAASEKQVTINTIASVAQLAVFIVYLIYTNVKNGRLKKQLAEVSEKLDKQIKGTNGLIERERTNGTVHQERRGSDKESDGMLYQSLYAVHGEIQYRSREQGNDKARTQQGNSRNRGRTRKGESRQ